MATSVNVTGVTNPFAVLSGGSTATSANADTTASADRFLTMLVTQLQNQDPLNPMDNAQITSQMAQINAVTGLEKVNESVKGLNTQLLQMQAWQGAALVGREVVVEGNQLAVSGGVGRGAVDLAGKAGAVDVSIVDASGREVGKVALGERAAGRSSFDFDMGSLPADRSYTFKVTASSGKSAVAASTLSFDRVLSVSTSGDGLTLALQRGGTLPVGQVVAFN